MKISILALLFTLITMVVSAQQEQEALLSEIVKNAKTNFLNITGTKISLSDDGSTFYEPTVKLGIGKEYVKKTKLGNVTYVLTSKYDKVKDLEKTVHAYIYSNFSKPEFTINSKKSEFTEDSYLEVYEKNASKPFLVVEVELTSNLETNLILQIYGKRSAAE